MADRNRESRLIRPISRREALKDALALGAAASLGPALAACGSSNPSVGGRPRKGGNLRVGLVGGSGKDTADPHRALLVPDDALNWNMFEGLMQYTPDLKPELNLAEEVTPNRDATEWTVRVKPDILWHDGKPLTADDVVFSFQRIVNPKAPLDGSSALGGLKPSGISKVDSRTVKFSWDTPNVLFGTDGLTQRLVHVVPVDFDPQKPIGTGPFKLESFQPGSQFVLSAFADHHGGAPYLDKVTLIEFADPTARVNALLGGTVDALVELPPSQVNSLPSEFAALNVKTGGWVTLGMRTDQEPFTDVRVRQAFRLIADRPQILQNAYGKVGWIGNDMYGVFDAGYPKDLPQRGQDLERAKFLLEQAGHEGLSIDLQTSDGVSNGAVAEAQVFAEQAKGAGVTVNVKKLDSGVLYGDRYLSWPFAMDWWSYRNYLQMALYATAPTAPYNATHWKNDKWWAIVQEALRTINDAKRSELVAEAERIEYDEGGYGISTLKNQLDAYSTRVHGLVTNDRIGSPLGRWRLSKVYLA